MTSNSFCVCTVQIKQNMSKLCIRLKILYHASLYKSANKHWEPNNGNTKLHCCSLKQRSVSSEGTTWLEGAAHVHTGSWAALHTCGRMHVSVATLTDWRVATASVLTTHPFITLRSLQPRHRQTKRGDNVNLPPPCLLAGHRETFPKPSYLFLPILESEGEEEEDRAHQDSDGCRISEITRQRKASRSAALLLRLVTTHVQYAHPQLVLAHRYACRQGAQLFSEVYCSLFFSETLIKGELTLKWVTRLATNTWSCAPGVNLPRTKSNRAFWVLDNLIFSFCIFTPVHTANRPLFTLLLQRETHRPLKSDSLAEI